MKRYILSSTIDGQKLYWTGKQFNGYKALEKTKAFAKHYLTPGEAKKAIAKLRESKNIELTYEEILF